jgi:acyl dehydratase
MLSNCGRLIDLGIWSIDANRLEDYFSATSTAAASRMGIELIPPVMLTAEVLTILIDKLELPWGTIHSGQEINAYKLVKPGQYVLGWANASKPSIKGQWQFVAIDYSLSDQTYNLVLRGRTTVMVPVC